MDKEEKFEAGEEALAYRTVTLSTLGDFAGASVWATASIYQCDCPVKQLNTYFWDRKSQLERLINRDERK